VSADLGMFMDSVPDAPPPLTVDADHVYAKAYDMLANIQAREMAESMHAELNALDEPPMDVGTLREILADNTPLAWRIDGLLAVEGRMTIVSPRKTGKTTLTLNLARCLLEGRKFLGKFDTAPVEGNVAFLNYEVSGSQLAAWAIDHNLDLDRFVLINLRGRRNPMASPSGRAELVEILKSHNVSAMIVDPFGRAFTGKSQDAVSDVAPWLIQLDKVASDAGVGEVILTVHAGWSGDRSRGSSGLEDWPDTITNLIRTDDGGRSFKAEGRDVDVPLMRLDYDPVTRELLAVGSASEDVSDAILEFLRENPMSSGKAIEDWAIDQGYKRTQARTERTKLVEAGKVVESRLKSRGGGTGYSLAD